MSIPSEKQLAALWEVAEAAGVLFAYLGPWSEDYDDDTLQGKAYDDMERALNELRAIKP